MQGDLLRAMMLKSYNDAAVALAEHVSGSVEGLLYGNDGKSRHLLGQRIQSLVRPMVWTVI